MLPNVDTQNGLIAGVAGTHHERVVLVGCCLDGQGAILCHCQPGPACTNMPLSKNRERAKSMSEVT